MARERSDPRLTAGRTLLVGGPKWRASVAAAWPDDAKSAGSAAAALDAAVGRPDAVDYAVVAADLPDGDGVSLLRALLDARPDLPVVVAAADGSEALAGRALEAGAADYVPLGATADPSERFEATRRRVRESFERRRDARRFDAVFADPSTYLTVLSPDGTVRRANDAVAAEFADDVVGAPLWDLPWWASAPDARRRLRDAVGRAADGEVASLEVESAGDDGAPRSIAVSVRPVSDGGGRATELLVEASDVTERVRLAEELRESEQLHRVTLNNMTDTVLIADDDGAFTYVCPNVHFIFGYTADEIRDLGTVDALLGPDLYDPDTLDDEGVLTNVECTATDKAGREHALLVNVRRVDIQGGTTLFSCRDVTKRKQRERALDALHDTARELLYAETTHEIGRAVVDDVGDVLGAEAAAVYLYDAEDNALRPTAYSDGMVDLDGPPPTLATGEESLVTHSFVEDETLAFDDVRDAASLRNPETGVRSAMVVPLDEYGVFVVGDAAVGAFDDVTHELADLLAALGEAALHRVERESQLRERDRTLHRQNAALTRLNRTNEIIREIDQALVRAETREDVERAVCEKLTAADRFSFAWIGDRDGSSDLEPRAWAGDDRGYLDSVPLRPGDDGDALEPAVETAETGEPTVVSNVADRLREGSWRKRALSRDYLSVISVPVAYDEFAYGTLTVYANQPDAFDDTSRAVLRELGETVASALAAVERRNALLGDSLVELEYETTDANCPLFRIARESGATLTLEGGLQRIADGVLAFVRVDGARPADVLDAAAESVAVERARSLDVDAVDGGGLVRLTLASPFIATTLADHGAVLRELTATPDAAHFTVEVPAAVDVRTVDDVVADAYPSSTLLAQRERERSPATRRRFRDGVLDDLTDRQLEVVRTAYHSGFFESPRASTGEEVAESLGISPPAFYKHTRKVQRKLFALLFDEALRHDGG